MLKTILFAASLACLAPSATHAQSKQFELGPYSSSHRDADLVSPKSALFHPTLPKLYINALEAGKTVVYSTETFSKLKAVEHKFADHQTLGPGTRFYGKPVEGWFTHEGRYLWVTYYRFSDDPHSSRASGFSVIDTRTDQIVKTYPTGNIPKFVTANESGTVLAVTLWGENKVEFHDVKDPLNAKLVKTVAVGGPVRAAVGFDRDKTCGLCLRGTAFLPKSDLVVVARMGGGGLALIDSAKGAVVRNLFNVPATPRYLQVYADYLYLSANASGTVARIKITDLVRAASEPSYLPPVQSRKVGAGARTLKVADDKVYVSLNLSKKVLSMNLDFSDIREVDAPAFPVGLDVKDDTLVVTSQGRQGVGGHRVAVYQLETNPGSRALNTPR